jgi:type IV fimbrial biogenesis protein FimT
MTALVISNQQEKGNTMVYAAPHHHGFSLIELMVALTIAAVVLSMGMPGMQQFIRDSRMTTQANDLITLINLSRSQAIHEGHRAELCISADQQSCSNGSWADGWLVWVDRNDNQTLDADEVSRIGAAIRLHTSAQSLNSAASSFTALAFLPTGFADLGTGVAFATITLQPNQCSGEEARQITINASGAAKTVRSSCTV